ncbi:MAG: EAL domain-containing protein [Clostridia bacterium]|nr:EAL domain-containing protein [Clostridia bacterium]
MKFKWTLYRKIQILIIIILIVVFGVSQIAISSIVKSEMEQSFNNNVLNTVVLLQNNMKVVFNNALSSLNYIEEEYAERSRDDIYIRQILDLVVSSKNYIMNAYVAYEDSSFVLEPNQAISSDFDPTKRKWYTHAVGSSSIYWSSPYYDEATGLLVITASKAIEIEGVDCVAGVDIDLNLLPDIINSTIVGNSGYIMLVNEDKDIIAISNGSDINKVIDLGDPEFISSDIISGRLSTKKGVYYLRGLADTNIRIVSFSPHSEIILATENMVLMAFVVIVSTFLVGVIFSYFFAKRITKPIEALTTTMALSVDSEKLIPYTERTNDEIDTLIDSYNHLVINVNDKNDALYNLSKELKKSEQKLQEQYDKVTNLAYYDYLTGLPNRLIFEQEVKKKIAREENFALFYVDLDNFKYINDTYGHNYGDFVLKIVSQRFKNCCDRNQFSARLSGDEFGILIKTDGDLTIDSAAREMLEMIQKPISYDTLEFTVTCSIGICLFPEDGKSFEDLLSNADIAMYEAKGKSKNQYMIFNQLLRDELVERVKIETRLLSALDNNEIYVCYQPLIDFKNRSVKGFEALLRWNSSDLGPVYPDIFIPIAEKNLYINSLGYYVMEESIRFGREIFDETGVFYEMNVNISLIQLHLENFVDEVLNLLDLYDFPAIYLNLEITESVALESDEKIHTKLKALRASGIKLSLDDFGTGYSSLHHLLNIRLTHLKIDRLIIVQATKDQEVFRLIHGIVDFAHAIGLKVVAEGIEDVHMEELMAQMQIDYAQGYLYSKPIIEQQVLKFLKEVDS